MEIYTIIGRKIPTMDSWLLSEDNHPLAPDTNLTATELCTMPADKVRDLLASAAIRISGRGQKLKDSMTMMKSPGRTSIAIETQTHDDDDSIHMSANRGNTNKLTVS
jgi:hypothetical protein